jgi:hypothetical protein
LCRDLRFFPDIPAPGMKYAQKWKGPARLAGPFLSLYLYCSRNGGNLPPNYGAGFLFWNETVGGEGRESAIDSQFACKQRHLVQFVDEANGFDADSDDLADEADNVFRVIVTVRVVDDPGAGVG